jgi:hypothetical protein
MNDELDVIANGVGSGTVAKRLMDVGFHANSLRPYTADDGKTYITVNDGKGGWKPQRIVANDATLRYDEWKLIDRAVVAAAKPRLRAVADLQQRGLTLGINGMGTSIFLSQTMSDINDAEVSMSGIKRSDQDRPVFGTSTLPLPIIHKDFSYTAREIATSRNGGTPLDTTTAELAARKVAEIAEKMLLGTYASYVFDGAAVFGYTNYTYRNTKTDMADWANYPTVDGDDIMADVMAMITKAKDDYHYGPYMLYVCPAFGLALENDFKAASDRTVRERLLAIEGIAGIQTLDYLTDKHVVLVEMQSDTVRLIEGMALQVVQWPSYGGLQTDFKVMMIAVPQIRSDYNTCCGIVHGNHT